MPSPVHYAKPGFFSPKQSMNAFSFGVSRDNMKKIHIQAIEKVAMEKLPAPNAYSMPSTFGKVGPHYSLRADTSRTESKENAQLIYLVVTRFIQKKGLEPGPGEYKKIEVVGTLNPSKLTSIIQTPQANAFSKAKDRFSIPSNNRWNHNFFSSERQIARTRIALPQDQLPGAYEQLQAQASGADGVR